MLKRSLLDGMAAALPLQRPATRPGGRLTLFLNVILRGHPRTRDSSLSVTNDGGLQEDEGG